MRKGLFNNLFLALLLLGLDYFTKAMALSKIPPLQGMHFPFGGIALFENVLGVSGSLNLVANTGIAWGFFAGHPLWLLVFRLIVIAGLVGFVLLRFPAQTALWLIVAGALGNVLDMFLYGHVIDFLHFQFFGWSFPLFNVADSCITIGTFLFVFFSKQRSFLQVGNHS